MRVIVGNSPTPKVANFLQQPTSTTTGVMKGFHEQVIKELKDVGTYWVHSRTLNTEEHGVPQHRERWYMVGIRKDAQEHPFTWPMPSECGRIRDYLDMTKSQAELPEVLMQFTEEQKESIYMEQPRCIITDTVTIVTQFHG